MPLDQLDAPTLTALSEHVARIKHDLGKYVAFQIRWLGPDAAFEERRDALAADLLATKRGPEGEIDAAALWAHFRPALVGQEALGGDTRADLSGDPSVRAIDEAMATVAEVAAALREGRANEEDVHRGSEAALAVADACRELQRRVREREE